MNIKLANPTTSHVSTSDRSLITALLQRHKNSKIITYHGDTHFNQPRAVVDQPLGKGGLERESLLGDDCERAPETDVGHVGTKKLESPQRRIDVPVRIVDCHDNDNLSITQHRQVSGQVLGVVRCRIGVELADVGHLAARERVNEHRVDSPAIVATEEGRPFTVLV